MAQDVQVTPKSGVASLQLSQKTWAWIGVAPFFIFALMFLILPTLDLMVGAFQDGDGNFTLQNLLNLNTPTIISAYVISLKVSIASALTALMPFRARGAEVIVVDGGSRDRTMELAAPLADRVTTAPRGRAARS